MISLSSIILIETLNSLLRKRCFNERFKFLHYASRYSWHSVAKTNGRSSLTCLFAHRMRHDARYCSGASTLRKFSRHSQPPSVFTSVDYIGTIATQKKKENFLRFKSCTHFLHTHTHAHIRHLWSPRGCCTFPSTAA